MRISDWSSDVCSSDLRLPQPLVGLAPAGLEPVEQSALHRPGLSVGRDASKTRLVEGVHHLSGHVELALLGGTVADPHGSAALVAGQPRELELRQARSEEHTSELQSLMRISYAVFCLKKKNQTDTLLRSDTQIA